MRRRLTAKQIQVVRVYGVWRIGATDELKALAEECGIDLDLIKVGSELEGVNLNLHVKKP